MFPEFDARSRGVMGLAVSMALVSLWTLSPAAKAQNRPVQSGNGRVTAGVGSHFPTSFGSRPGYKSPSFGSRAGAVPGFGAGNGNFSGGGSFNQPRGGGGNGNFRRGGGIILPRGGGVNPGQGGIGGNFGQGGGNSGITPGPGGGRSGIPLGQGGGYAGQRNFIHPMGSASQTRASQSTGRGRF